ETEREKCDGREDREVLPAFLEEAVDEVVAAQIAARDDENVSARHARGEDGPFSAAGADECDAIGSLSRGELYERLGLWRAEVWRPGNRLVRGGIVDRVIEGPRRPGIHGAPFGRQIEREAAVRGSMHRGGERASLPLQRALAK